MACLTEIRQLDTRNEISQWRASLRSDNPLPHPDQLSQWRASMVCLTDPDPALTIWTASPIPIPWSAMRDNLVFIAKCYNLEVGCAKNSLKRLHEAIEANEENYARDCGLQQVNRTDSHKIALLKPFVDALGRVTSALKSACQMCNDEKKALLLAFKLEHVMKQGHAISERYGKPYARDLCMENRTSGRKILFKLIHATVDSHSFVMTQIIETLQLGAVLDYLAVFPITGQLQACGDEATPLENRMPLEMELPESGTIANAGTIIQEIEHVDVPAIRDEEAASLMVRAQADEDFARIAEKHISRLSSANVYLISFRSGGKGELFRKMLLQDAEFNPIRVSLKAAGYPAILEPSKAIVLVHPDQYLDTMSALANQQLKHYNVVIAGFAEYLIDQVLLRMASKQQPRENRQEREELDLFAGTFVEKRSFLCECPTMAGTQPEPSCSFGECPKQQSDLTSQPAHIHMEDVYEKVKVLDLSSTALHSHLREEARRYTPESLAELLLREALEFTIGAGGPCSFHFIPKSAKHLCQGSVLDGGYMNSRVFGKPFNEALDDLNEFVTKPDPKELGYKPDCWSLEHRDAKARGKCKDGVTAVVGINTGKVYASASRLDHKPRRFHMEGGCRHSATLGLVEWLREQGHDSVALVRSETGKVTVIVSQVLFETGEVWHLDGS